ncbi:SGNH/GDSL hydrolase family protein [Glycomyces sp. TRM65418]|uniref:SGNH/GDSL hydrolase family protein n=1 Tax=Glycomyces sp. TRM65418 TaxID=2867006 RepID=UPI001CE568DC|nr:SGNH/GDSL hydrolase family protein [Glycomyces sp. TRM65418]MCC3765359.1 SGNH/GDSL hydrolase family protein [Glycomyces sp. TRM65418]QZD54976.1 SGNH/GDSL hydrolase family protein [Glycomyces sp. TRM65418]
MSAHTRKRGVVVRALAAAAAAGIGAAMLAGPASAGPTTWQPQYVALGDSYVSGVGAGDYLADDGCYRSANAYPVLAAEAVGAKLSFDACSGARVEDVVANQLDNLSWRTREVTIGVGGNDAGFSSVLGACAGTDTALCEGAIANAQAVITDSLPAELDDLYTQVEDRAWFADVTVVGNPRLFNETSCSGTLAITPAEQALLNETADLLAETTAEVAADHGFDFADVRDAFVGHEVCSSDPWILGYVGTLESFHANAAGYAAYAEVVTPYLERC